MSTRRHRPKAQRADPQRTCLGCRRQARQGELLRLVRSPAGEVVVDHPRRLGGRGAYVCSSVKCLRQVLRPALLERSLGGAVSAPALDTLVDSVRERVRARIEGLLAAAGRARKVAVGAADTESALIRQSAMLVILAADLSPRVRSGIEDAARRTSVKVSELGDKGRLGLAFARSEVGAIALTDPGFAEAVSVELRILDGISATQAQNGITRQSVEALERAT